MKELLLFKEEFLQTIFKRGAYGREKKFGIEQGSKLKVVYGQQKGSLVIGRLE